MIVKRNPKQIIVVEPSSERLEFNLSKHYEFNKDTTATGSVADNVTPNNIAGNIVGVNPYIL